MFGLVTLQHQLLREAALRMSKDRGGRSRSLFKNQWSTEPAIQGH